MATLPVNTPEENPTLLLPASGLFRCSLACGCIILASTSVFTEHSPPHCVSSLLFLKGLVIGFKVGPILEWFPHFHIFILVTSAKSFFPNKGTCTNSWGKDIDISFGGPPVNPVQPLTHLSPQTMTWSLRYFMTFLPFHLITFHINSLNSNCCPRICLEEKPNQSLQVK